MALHAEKFFTQQLHLTDGTVIGDICYATPRPDSPLRLRIGFSRTIRVGEYDGLRLQILHADQGAVLDSVLLTFADHDTFRSRDAAIDRHPGYDGYAKLRDWHERDEPPWQGAATTKLRRAIEQYPRLWFPQPPAAPRPARGPRPDQAALRAVPLTRRPHGPPQASVAAPAESQSAPPGPVSAWPSPAGAPFVLPDPFKDLDPTQPVKVLPRHLAGPGPMDIHTAWPFPFDEDWSLHQPDEGTAYATSPCLRLWTRFTPEPEKQGKGTWTIGANRAPFGQTAWQITFDATTPVELLHDVHAELLDLHREDRNRDQDRLFDDPTAPYEGYARLFARGWSHDVTTGGTQTFLAPDRLGGVRHRYSTRDSDTSAWRVWGGYPSEPLWQAHFSFATPTTLVAAFTASLISTEPLHRTVQDVPFHTRHHLYVATAATKQQPGYSPAAPPPATAAGRRTR